jgi:beta-xylosidase
MTKTFSITKSSAIDTHLIYGDQNRFWLVNQQ